MNPIKATITYKLADVLALATEMKTAAEKTAAGHKGGELIAGYNAAMVTASQRNVAKLEEFRAAGVETLEADHLIAEAHPHTLRSLGGYDTSLSNQLRNGTVRPLIA